MHVCPFQYSSRTLPATQFKSGLLADKLSEVQMSYFYLCSSVCHYLWIIKFLEWAYRKKWGDMRGYFHRLEYWGFIFRLILLRFSFVFFINLPIRKSYRMVLSFRFWALFDYWIFPTSRLFPMLLFSCSVDWKLRWLSFLSVLSVFVDFPFWMRLGVRYHCYYVYSVVCQQIWRNVLPLFFPRYTGVKKTQHYKLFISNPIVLFWRTKKKPTAT